jgi:protein-disulfide isomerase
VHGGDHVRGEGDLELVMYGDFECPYCVAAQRIIPRVEKRLDGRLRFVYRHFPLAETHPHAREAAAVAEAAGERFWDMHDAIYRLAGRLRTADLVRAAADLGLDTARIGQELGAGIHDARIDHDIETGRASGVTGTPGFFANGTRLSGAFDAGSIVAALRA